MQVLADALHRDDVVALVRSHVADMHRHSPARSVHALAPSALRALATGFWVARDASGELMGCGALQEVAADHGEIKSMRTADGYLRRGVAAAILAQLLQSARDRGMRRVSLETGSAAAFAPAQALYARFGFEPCGPFGGYVEDPCSVFMTRTL